jgi:hypothetical protein
MASETKMARAREIVSEEWGRAVKEFNLRPGTVTETVVSRIINRLDALEHEKSK